MKLSSKFGEPLLELASSQVAGVSLIDQRCILSPTHTIGYIDQNFGCLP